MMPLIPSTHSHNLKGFQGFSAIIMSSESNAVQAVTPCRPQQRCQKADQSLRLRLEENCGSVHLCSPLSSKTFKDLGDSGYQVHSMCFFNLIFQAFQASRHVPSQVLTLEPSVPGPVNVPAMQDRVGGVQSGQDSIPNRRRHDMAMA